MLNIIYINSIIRPRKTCSVQPGIRLSSADTHTAPPDTLREGPSQASEGKPLPQRDLRIRGYGAHRGPLLPDEEENLGGGLPR